MLVPASVVTAMPASVLVLVPYWKKRLEEDPLGLMRDWSTAALEAIPVAAKVVTTGGAATRVTTTE